MEGLVQHPRVDEIVEPLSRESIEWKRKYSKADQPTQNSPRSYRTRYSVIGMYSVIGAVVGQVLSFTYSNTQDSLRH